MPITLPSEASGFSTSLDKAVQCTSHVVPVTYGWPKTLASLKAAFDEAHVDDWDGEGGRAALQGAYEEAWRFVMGIRPFVPMPEVDVSPMGGFLLTWHSGPRRRLSVLLTGERSIIYAALVGAQRHKGTFGFGPEDAVPASLVLLVQQVAA